MPLPRPLAALRHSLGLLWSERRCPVCLEVYMPMTVQQAMPPRPFSLAPYEPHSPLPLCPQCAELLRPKDAAYCPMCGTPLPEAAAHPFPCPRCLTDPPPWTHFAFAALYEDHGKELFSRYKFHNDWALTPVIAHLLLVSIQRLPEADMLVPMPQHIQRLKWRGSNPIYEAARRAARMAGIKFVPEALCRVRQVRPQEGLSARERSVNPKGSFGAQHVQGKRVILADDIFTTGSTVRHASACLRQAGASAVYVAVAARTPWRG